VFTHLAASERNIDQLDVELVRALCLGEHGLLGMLSTGDALNEVHDRSQTAFTQLARLGTTLVTGLMSAADSFTPEALRASCSTSSVSEFEANVTPSLPAPRVGWPDLNARDVCTQAVVLALYLGRADEPFGLARTRSCPIV
jgi:hypothetical protein